MVKGSKKGIAEVDDALGVNIDVTEIRHSLGEFEWADCFCGGDVGGKED